MIFNVSWRNIWRSPIRSLVVMGSIAIGVWSIIFLSGLVTGMMTSYIATAINNETSHIQVHHPDFQEEKEAKYFFENGSQLIDKISAVEGIKAVTSRSLTNAMIASGKGGRGVQLYGVQPEQEQNITKVSSKMVEGTYFPKKRNCLVISKRLSEKLKVKLRSKLVLTFQDLEGNIASGAFRVVGIFDTGNNMFDDNKAFIRQSDMNKLLQNDGISHELAILINEGADVDSLTKMIAADFPAMKVQSYKEIAPELVLFQSQIKMTSQIYMVIFMLALIFGIINTMLMAVLERMRELGMLMAIGMSKVRVFFMVMIETIMLGVVSAPIGLLAGYWTISYFNKNGLDLFFFSEDALKQFGMSKLIYPFLETDVYVQLAIAVLITALLASIYPALKAIRLKPVQAIRKL